MHKWKFVMKVVPDNGTLVREESEEIDADNRDLAVEKACNILDKKNRESHTEKFTWKELVDISSQGDVLQKA